MSCGSGRVDVVPDSVVVGDAVVVGIGVVVVDVAGVGSVDVVEVVVGVDVVGVDVAGVVVVGVDVVGVVVVVVLVVEGATVVVVVDVDVVVLVVDVVVVDVVVVDVDVVVLVVEGATVVVVVVVVLVVVVVVLVVVGGVAGCARTFIEKYWPAHVPDTVVQLPPEFEEDSRRNVGVGDTEVVGGVALHFHPIVPPALPVITTKYCEPGASANGVARENDGEPSPHAATETPVATSANFTPGLPLAPDQMLSEYELGVDPESFSVAFRSQMSTETTSTTSAGAVKDCASQFVPSTARQAPSPIWSKTVTLDAADRVRAGRPMTARIPTRSARRPRPVTG